MLQPATALEDAQEAMLEAMDAEDHDIEDEVQTHIPDNPQHQALPEPVLAAEDMTEPSHEEEDNTDAEALLEPVRYRGLKIRPNQAKRRQTKRLSRFRRKLRSTLYRRHNPRPINQRPPRAMEPCADGAERTGGAHRTAGAGGRC